MPENDRTQDPARRQGTFRRLFFMREKRVLTELEQVYYQKTGISGYSIQGWESSHRCCGQTSGHRPPHKANIRAQNRRPPCLFSFFDYLEGYVLMKSCRKFSTIAANSSQPAPRKVSSHFLAAGILHGKLKILNRKITCRKK